MRTRTAVLAMGAVLAFSGMAGAFSYQFAGEANGIDIVTHPTGYTGAGGVLTVTVGIDPTSAFASDMVIPTQNVVYVWNQLAATTGNVKTGEISANAVDFESVLLDKIGHACGLGHPNAGPESGLAGSLQDSTKATDGANNVFDVDAGADGIYGSADDPRGDDVNLNWFHRATNDPFDPANVAGVVDSTTYGRQTAYLPGADSFAACPGRLVGPLYGYSDTEAAMKSGHYYGETRRALVADDVAGMRYAAAGLDAVAGTGDDYTLNLVYNGLTTDADIVIDFDDAQTSFSNTQVSGAFLSADHVRITAASVYFNTAYPWHFNDTLVPEPATLSLLALLALSLPKRGGLVLIRRRRT